MPPALHPVLKDDICQFHPRGECTLVEAVELVRQGIAHCRDHGIRKMLINGTALTGVPIPTLVDRFLMAEEWAEEGKGTVMVVLVILAQYIHPEKFGVQVARDFGLMTDVYTSDEEARAWLSTFEP